MTAGIGPGLPASLKRVKRKKMRDEWKNEKINNASDVPCYLTDIIISAALTVARLLSGNLPVNHSVRSRTALLTLFAFPLYKLSYLLKVPLWYSGFQRFFNVTLF